MTVGPVARNSATEEFFDAAAEGRFLLRRCTPHGHLSRPQSRQCPDCASTDLEWVPASGRARLVSWSVVPVRSPDAGDEPPVLIPAIGELEEGPWWWSMVVGSDPDSLVEGQALQIGFERPGGSEAVPIFVVEDDRTG